MKYDLVFEGGGAKGVAFTGALEVFEKRGHTYGRLLGTSAGAITAALLAAGYTAEEMRAALCEQVDDRPVFADFMSTPGPFDDAMIQASATRKFLRQLDIPLLPERFEEKLDDWLAKCFANWPGLRHLFSFIECGGWYSADHFFDWLRQRLDNRTFHGQSHCFSDKTLWEFYEETQVDLSLVATDTTAQQMLVLNHCTAPKLPLIWAVRMSMSIPLIWPEVIWQATWGEYRGKDMTAHTIVDGGVLSNFPLELFVSGNAMVTKVMGLKTSKQVLGLLIDETQPVSGANLAAEPAAATLDLAELRIVKRLSNLLNTMMCAHDKMVIEVFDHLVARLPAKGYSTTEFDMGDDRRDRLVAAGEEAMTAYLGQVSATRALRSNEDEARTLSAADKLARRILGE